MKPSPILEALDEKTSAKLHQSIEMQWENIQQAHPKVRRLTRKVCDFGGRTLARDSAREDDGEGEQGGYSRDSNG